MKSLAGLRWLLPEALYRAAGLAETVQDPFVPQARLPAPDWPVLDGPASQALDAWLRPLLPPGLVRCRSEDYGTPPRTTATVRYRDPHGGYVRILQRRLTRPLLLDALCDAKHDGFVRVLPNGTDVIRRGDLGARGLVTVSPDGTMVLIDAIGEPERGIDAPISDEQLDQLELALDRLSLDTPKSAGSDGSRGKRHLETSEDRVAGSH